MITIEEEELKETQKKNNALSIVSSFVFGFINVGSWLGGFWVGVMGFAHWLNFWGNPEAGKIAYTGALVIGIWFGVQILLVISELIAYLIGINDVEETSEDDEVTSVFIATAIQSFMTCMLIYAYWNAMPVDHSIYLIDTLIMKGMMFGISPFIIFSMEFPDDATILRKLGLGKWMDVTIKLQQ